MQNTLHLFGLERCVMRDALNDRITVLGKSSDENADLHIKAAQSILAIMDKQEAREAKRNARNDPAKS